VSATTQTQWSGRCAFGPITDLNANRAWLDMVCFADALVRWFQRLCCRDHLAIAEPKTLRWGLWHTPARIIRHSRRTIIRILDGWPSTGDILYAHQQIATLT